MKLLICVTFGEYAILVKNYSLSDKNISSVLYNEDLIIFSSLAVQKNQLKTRNSIVIRLFLCFLFLCNNDIFVRGSGVRKFNNSLLFNTDFVKKLKSDAEIVKSNLHEKFSFSNHTKLELLKYGIQKFSISFSKNLPKTERIIQKNLENRIKTEEDVNAYNLCKLHLENIYD